MRKSAIILCFALAALASCNKEQSGGSGAVAREGDPIEVVDGKVTFIVKAATSLE